MNEALKTMLFATAASEVISFIRAFTDKEHNLEKTLEFANELGSHLGIPKVEATEMFKLKFEKSKNQLDSYIENVAGAEVAAAVKEAELEQISYASKREELNQMLAEQLALIVRRKTPIETSLDIAFYEKLEQQIRSSHTGLMLIAQQMHREFLRYTFCVHLIGEATAKKLADLYEIK